MPIFISHSNAEDEQASKALNLIRRQIEKFKLEHGGVKTFLDREVLKPGDFFSAKILKALAETTLAIILISKDVLSRSAWVRFEAGVMYWRWHFDDRIHLLHVLAGVSAAQYKKAFSPLQPGQFLYEKYDENNEAELELKIETLLKTHRDATDALLADPGYQGLKEILEVGGETAAKALLADYKSGVPLGDWPSLFDCAAALLATAPVDMQMIAGFKGYLYLLTRDESANWLMLYIKKQTTPLWYVSRLRPAFIAPTGEPIRAPSVSYIAGKRPMLVEQHLARAFRGADKYEFRLVTLPAAVSRPISVNDLQSYRIGTLRRTMELIKFVKDKAAAYAVFIVVQTDYDIDESIYSFWTTEFASLPAHLLVLRAREDEQSLEGEQVEEVQSAARPFIPAEDNPPHSIASLAYLTEDEEAKQDDWIFYIEDTYEGWQEKRGRVLRVSLE